MRFYKRICLYLILCLFSTFTSAKIVFLAAPTRADNYSIYVMDDDGSNRTLVYDGKTTPSIYDVHWSPAGQLVFEARGVFYFMNADGTHLRRLPHIEGLIRSFTLSPDGQQIMFELEERIENQKAVQSIQILTVQTGKIRKIRDIPAGEGIGYLDWSPDGKKVLFATPILLGGAKLGNSIGVMDASGKNVKELLAPPGIGELNISRWFPTWSPDSAQFVYKQNEYTWEERKPGVISEIIKAYRCIISDKAGRTLRKLNVPKQLAASFFAWMDKGKSIIFEGTEKDLNEPPPEFGKEPPDHIYKYNLQTNKLVNLTRGTKEKIGFVDWISDDVLPVSPQGKKKVMWGMVKQQNSKGLTHKR